MKPRLLATSACLALLAIGLPAPAAPPPGSRQATAQQRVGHYLELVVDERGQGLSGGVFDFPVHPDRVTQVYFPEDIERGTGFPGSKFHVEMGKRRVTIYPTRRAARKKLEANLTLKTSSVAVGLLLRVVDTPEEAVTMAFVTKRSEQEARQATLAAQEAEMRARTEQVYEERHRQLERELDQRADEEGLARFLAHGTPVRPAIVEGDVAPHAPGAPAVTLSNFQAMWWGADDMLVSFEVKNTGETAFDWNQAQVFGPKNREDHAGAVHVQMPAIPAEGLVGRLPGGQRARGAVLVKGAKKLGGPMTIVLGEQDGFRPVMVTVGNWLPLQTEEPLPGWEIRPAEPPDLEKGMVSLSLEGVYGAIWLGDGAGLDQSEATSMKGLGVRAAFSFNRYIAIEAEIMGAGTGQARLSNVTYDGMQGDLMRSASLGRMQLGGVVRLDGSRWVPLARLGVGLQGASHNGQLTTATGEAPGPESFEWTTFGAFGAGLDVRFGDFLAGLAVSVLTPWGDLGDGLMRGAIEAGIHLGYRWNP